MVPDQRRECVAGRALGTETNLRERAMEVRLERRY